MPVDLNCAYSKGKYGAAVVTSCGWGDETIVDYINHIPIAIGIKPVGEVRTAMSGMPKGGFTDGVQEKARNVGKRLVEALSGGDVPYDIDKCRNDFRELMSALMSYRKEEWSYE